MTQYVYIETVGCQMNVLDSEMVVAILKQHGYEVVDDPTQADTILFNTCSVRQHAEDKIYSALGKLRRCKQSHPEKIIGVLGCMAQKDQQLIFQRAPFVDLVVGPGQLQQTADLIERARSGAGRQVAVSLGRRDGPLEQIRRSHETFDPLRDPQARPTPFQAYLRIQIGCDKFCTYCVVPSTRGPEQGRPPEQIFAEAQVLADQGCLEITLLGQTVNSYEFRAGGKTTRLADLLNTLHGIDGIRRLKFVTNYPLDLPRELLQAVRDLPKCSPYLHVPLQSGSNRVLARMKRGYTVEAYRDMLARVREILPTATVSSDFIVGFCGETEEDFQQSVQMVCECRFKNSYIFKYSERAGTKAAERLPDDVPEDVKRRRNTELLALQDQISEADQQAFLGRTVEVLVEGPSRLTEKRGDEGAVVQLTGRTRCDRIVVFDGPRPLAGQILPVTIYDCTAHTLIGGLARDQNPPDVIELGRLLPKVPQ
jgi:tRNA-2-methylthio-N6-dimethylallyladenosine synthase